MEKVDTPYLMPVKSDYGMLDEHDPLVMHPIIDLLLLLRQPWWLMLWNALARLPIRGKARPFVMRLQYESQVEEDAAIHQLVRCFNKAIVPDNALLHRLLPLEFDAFETWTQFFDALRKRGGWNDPDGMMMQYYQAVPSGRGLFAIQVVNVSPTRSGFTRFSWISLEPDANGGVMDSILPLASTCMRDMSDTEIAQFHPLGSHFRSYVRYGRTELLVPLVTGLNTSHCGNCGNLAAHRRCGGCGTVHYCNTTTCQREHWEKEHKRFCALSRKLKLCATALIANSSTPDLFPLGVGPHQ